MKLDSKFGLFLIAITWYITEILSLFVQTIKRFWKWCFTGLSVLLMVFVLSSSGCAPTGAEWAAAKALPENTMSELDAKRKVIEELLARKDDENSKLDFYGFLLTLALGSVPGAAVAVKAVIDTRKAVNAANANTEAAVDVGRTLVRSVNVALAEVPAAAKPIVVESLKALQVADGNREGVRVLIADVNKEDIK